MTRMRKWPSSGGHGPVAAHEWVPLLGFCTVGPWPMGCCLLRGRGGKFRQRGGEVAGGAGGGWAATSSAAGGDRPGDRGAALGAGAGGGWAGGVPVVVRAGGGV